jgi:hypothetical protein
VSRVSVNNVDSLCTYTYFSSFILQPSEASFCGDCQVIIIAAVDSLSNVFVCVCVCVCVCLKQMYRSRMIFGFAYCVEILDVVATEQGTRGRILNRQITFMPLMCIRSEYGITAQTSLYIA